MEPLVLKTAGVLNLSDDELLRLCETNSELQIERDRHGHLIFTAPAGGATSNRNAALVAKLFAWNEARGGGRVFGPDGGFLLPNGAMRAPDASWIPNAHWEALSLGERTKFLPLCPDFLVELRSASDRLRPLQDKMEEWMENGCRLAWLIDIAGEQAFVYRVGEAEPERVPPFGAVLSGEDVLPGFELPLKALQ